jgi:hypothetical protein
MRSGDRVAVDWAERIKRLSGLLDAKDRQVRTGFRQYVGRFRIWRACLREPLHSKV